MLDYLNSEMLQAINETIHSERDRDILKRRKIDGITIERLSEEFEMSVSQIKRIIRKHESNLYEFKTNQK